MTQRPILCVDDEAANLTVLRNILEDHYPLIFARSGADALAATRKHVPAMILLDVEMPEFNGLEVCRQLKDDPLLRDIPVIFVTSLGAVGDEQAGFDVGAVDYITKPVSPPLVLARVRTHLSLVRVSQLEESHRAAIHMLGEAGHYNDTDTGAHIWRMAAFSRRLALAAGWSPEAAELLELAAPMHDTGKIGIPDAILKKPGKLDDDEWTIMRTHSQIGYDILSQSRAPVFQLAAEIALYHHERWDGSGYPTRLAGEDIPESARIVAVADVFDALSMKRPYKAPWPIERIVATLHDSAGSHLERRLVDLFVAHLDEMRDIQAHWHEREVLMGHALPPDAAAAAGGANMAADGRPAAIG